MLEIILSIGVVIAFVIGLFLGRRLSRVDGKYDGYLNVFEKDSSMINQLEIMTDPEKLHEQTAMVLKIRMIPPQD